jgi:GNAT superfamily N-acetyltransferase
MYAIRRAESKDIPILIEFRERMFRSFVDDFSDYDEMNEVAFKYFADKLEKNEVVAWVAENGERRIIACVAMSFYVLPPKPWNRDGRYGYVSNMFTEPSHRKKGLGGKLLQGALDYAKEIGIKSVTLHATEIGAQLYHSFGFRETEEMGIRF